MRTVIIVLACLLAGYSCQKAPRYVVDGKISGNAEGMKVTLNRVDYPQSELIDSTVIKDGKFVFEGSRNRDITRYRLIEILKGENSHQEMSRIVRSIWKIP